MSLRLEIKTSNKFAVISFKVFLSLLSIFALWASYRFFVNQKCHIFFETQSESNTFLYSYCQNFGPTTTSVTYLVAGLCLMYAAVKLRGKES